jgi:hypothetical protein
LLVRGKDVDHQTVRHQLDQMVQRLRLVGTYCDIDQLSDEFKWFAGLMYCLARQ